MKKRTLFPTLLFLCIFFVIILLIFFAKYICISAFSAACLLITLILFLMAYTDSKNAENGEPSHTQDSVIPENERALIYRARGKTMYILATLSTTFLFFAVSAWTIVFQTIYTLLSLFLAGVAGKINVSKTMKHRLEQEARERREQTMREESGYSYKHK